MAKLTQDRVLGLLAVALGLWLALYWAPTDSETGLIERVRGRSAVGDALAPTVAGVLIAFSGLWIAIGNSNAANALSLGNVGWIAGLMATLFVSLFVMRWGGPALVEAITGAEYRPQRDTPPWKYFGFVIGGTIMIAALIFWVERELRVSRIFIALAVAILLCLLYDLPFDDLILPPNGDV